VSKVLSQAHGTQSEFDGERCSDRISADAPRRFSRHFLRHRAVAAAALVLGGSALLAVPVTAAAELPAGTALRALAAPARAAVAAPEFAAGSIAAAGEVLLPGRALHTGSSRLLLTRNGDLELFSAGVQLWSSGTSGHPRARAVMQADGNLVLRTRSGKAIWSTRTAGRPGARLIVRSAAQAVVQSRAGRVLWQTSMSVKGYAITQLAVHGWSGDQWSCLQSLWQRESGWNWSAANPSGAYGIPQALPGSKMASAGSDWRTNPATQIRWGLGYIADRYGSPCGAWGHSESYGWY
jgi:hypothetical protein